MPTYGYFIVRLESPSGLKHALSTQNLRRKLLKRGRLLSYIDGILGVFEGTLRR